MKNVLRTLFGVWLIAGAPLRAQVPPLLNYQGRILVGTTAFEGTGRFKFSLVDRAGTQRFWSNAPDANADGEPDTAVSLPVSRGLYSVLLGDTAVANMAALPAASFPEGEVYLRVWFDDGVNGVQRLSPDQRLASVAFAFVAGSVPDGAISSSKIAPGAVQPSHLGGVLNPSQIPALDAALIGSGTLDAARLPSNVALKNPDLQGLADSLGNQISQLQGLLNALEARFLNFATEPPAPSGDVRASAELADPSLLGKGYTWFNTVPAASWSTGTAANAPTARVAHAAEWLGATGQLFVWGGQVGPGVFSDSGALYRPSTDTWQSLPGFGAPTARRGHSVVMDGTSAIVVWGGYSETGYVATGGRFDVAGNSWSPLSTANAPGGRDGHVAARVGSSMLVWGGRSSVGKLGDGAVYDLSADAWAPLSLPNAPEARSDAVSLALGDRVLIWGGAGATGELGTGSQLVFETGPSGLVPAAWRSLSAILAPSARAGHTAVWTGSQWIVWGGQSAGTPLANGASYEPATDTWTSLPTAGAPTARSGHVAVWTGEEMLIFGGESGGVELHTGGAYHPVTKRWRTLTVEGSPLARTDATAVWSGSELILFGGESGGAPLASLQRLVPQPAWHLYRKL